MRIPWGKAPVRRVRVTAPEPDPLVVEAESETARLEQMRAELRARRPERDAQRSVAREARERAEALVQRNHFGESIEYAMRRRA